jgi:hypothetical protein
MIVTGVHIKAGAEGVKNSHFFKENVAKKKHEIAWMYMQSAPCRLHAVEYILL